jgi:hypothetical protein
MTLHKERLMKAKIFCAVTISLVGYNFIMLLLFKLSPEETAHYVLNGQVMTGYFFIANIYHDYIMIKINSLESTQTQED